MGKEASLTPPFMLTQTPARSKLTRALPRSNKISLLRDCSTDFGTEHHSSLKQDLIKALSDSFLTPEPPAEMIYKGTLARG